MAEIPQSSFQGPLAPKFGLTDNAHGAFPHASIPLQRKRNISGLIPVAGIAIAILVLPLTIQQLGNNQDVRQRASGIEPTIALPTPVTTRPTPTITLTPTPTITQSATTGTPSPTLAPQTDSKNRKFEL